MTAALRSACETLQACEAAWGRTDGAVHTRVTPWGIELVLDRPAASNAMSVSQLRRLGEAVRWASANPAAIAMLRAEGKVFCAGGDLVEVQAHWLAGEAARKVAEAATTVLDALSRLPQVLILVVDGPAIGGGLELVTCGDHVVAGPLARFEPRQVALGVACGWGGAGRLVSRLGAARATRWMLDAVPLEARQACAMGLVDTVAEHTATEALTLATRWAARDAAAVRAWVAQRRACQPRPTAEELEAFLSVWGGEGHRAALAARKPR
jgi:enoyl-CoA hydratase/carnithine racemase